MNGLPFQTTPPAEWDADDAAQWLCCELTESISDFEALTGSRTTARNFIECVERLQAGTGRYQEKLAACRRLLLPRDETTKPR